MKKLLAIMLTLIMIFSLSVTVFAADITEGSDSKAANTAVTFNVDPTYAGDYSDTVTFTISIE